MIRFSFLWLLSLFASTTTFAATAASCATDDTFDVCVVSAALTPGFGSKSADVSLTFRVTNKTDYPIGLAFADNEFLFTPENAVSLHVSTALTVSGIGTCRKPCRNEERFVVFAPGRPLIVQVKYTGYVQSPGAFQLIRSATSASFSATMAVLDRGKMRIVPLAIPEFRFGNGFALR